MASSSGSKAEFIVGGKYKLVRKIGSGSFGDIYLAINITNGEVRAARTRSLPRARQRGPFRTGRGTGGQRWPPRGWPGAWFCCRRPPTPRLAYTCLRGVGERRCAPCGWGAPPDLRGGVGWHCPLRRQSPCGRGPPPPSSCMAHWGVLGRGDRRCGKNILLSFMSGQSRLSNGSHLSPSQLGNTISFSATAIATKKIPCFFSSFFLVFFPSFLPLTALSCKEETPTYVLSHLHGSEDFTSPAQFNDLGWIFTYRS